MQINILIIRGKPQVLVAEVWPPESRAVPLQTLQNRKSKNYYTYQSSGRTRSFFFARALGKTHDRPLDFCRAVFSISADFYPSYPHTIRYTHLFLCLLVFFMPPFHNISPKLQKCYCCAACGRYCGSDKIQVSSLCRPRVIASMTCKFFFPKRNAPANEIPKRNAPANEIQGADYRLTTFGKEELNDVYNCFSRQTLQPMRDIHPKIFAGWGPSSIKQSVLL